MIYVQYVHMLWKNIAYNDLTNDIYYGDWIKIAEEFLWYNKYLQKCRKRAFRYKNLE